MDNQELITYNNAIQLAVRAHDGQRRKNTAAAPYITHPLNVSRILIEAGVTDYNAIIAAVLHDVIEDSDYTEKDIADEINPEIAAIVQEVTNLDGENVTKAMKKHAQIEKSKTMSDPARLVKLADKADNLDNLATDPPIGWSPEAIAGYYDWSYAVCLNLFGLNAKLDERVRLLFEPYGLNGISTEDLTERLDRYYASM